MEFEGHTNSIRTMAIHGNTLVSTGKDMSVRVWDTRTSKTLWVFDGHEDFINDIAIRDVCSMM